MNGEKNDGGAEKDHNDRGGGGKRDGEGNRK